MSNEFSTGTIYHSCGSTNTSSHVQGNEINPDKVIKFCYGFDHMVLLKENGFIQPISKKNDLLSDSLECLQQLNIPIIDIAFGKEHALALTSDHRVCSFGGNTFGQLGIARIGNKNDENNQTHITKRPQFVNYFANVNQQIIQIKCGSYHSCALSQSGDIYTWGQGKYGQLGTKVLSIQILPRYVAHISSQKDIIQQITCGPEGTAAITKKGVLYQWGYGQSTPIHISFPEQDIQIKKISIGLAHSLCLTTCGKLYGWGLCMYGQLGLDANNVKKVTSPLLLKQFSEFNVYDIECCGLYSVICTAKRGIYILGYNDSLFDGQKHVVPFKVNLTTERIKCIGCSRYDFAVAAATNIHDVVPSTCCSTGTRIDIEGHGFYKTPFRPTVKYVINEDVSIIQTASFVIESKIRLSSTTPNLHEIEREHGLQIAYPYKIQVEVAMDGKYFSDPYDIYVIKKHQDAFNITPNCGDVQSSTECLITDQVEYISSMMNIEDLKLDAMKIKLVNSSGDDVCCMDAVLDTKECGIQFKMPSTGINAEEYQIWIAFDGQQYFNTNTTFIAYNIECVECEPDRINIAQLVEENKDIIQLELKVNGFISTNSEHIKLQFVGNDEEKCNFVTNCVYESQSARDINEKEEKIKKEYEEKREENKRNKEKEVNEIYESRKEKDAEREKWLAQTEKDRKKKKKPVDIQAFDEEVKKVNDEWESTLKERQIEIRQIERKYKKEWMAINKEESRITKEEEMDDGSGYLKCNVNVADIKQWQQPNDIHIKITANAVSFSDLYCIQSIAPQIKNLSPKLGLISESTQIKMIVDGFNLKNVDKNDIKISIQDTEDKTVQIEEFAIVDEDTNAISFAVSTLSNCGEKEIMLKYKDWFKITCIFLAHDAIKISGVTPNTFTIDESAKINVQLAKEMNAKYVDESYIEIKGNDKTMVLKGILSNENNKEISADFDAEQHSLANIGAAKKAQIRISFNDQHWITAKQTIAIK